MITSAEMRSKRVQHPLRGSEKDRLSGAARVVGGLWEFGASSVLALCHRHYSPPRRLPTVDNGKFENVAQRAWKSGTSRLGLSVTLTAIPWASAAYM